MQEEVPLPNPGGSQRARQRGPAEPPVHRRERRSGRRRGAPLPGRGAPHGGAGGGTGRRTEMFTDAGCGWWRRHRETHGDGVRTAAGTGRRTGRFTDTGCGWLQAPGRTVQSPRSGSPAAKAEAAPRAPETGAAEPNPSSPRLPPAPRAAGATDRDTELPSAAEPDRDAQSPAPVPLPGQEPPRPAASLAGHRAPGAPAAQPPPSRAPTAAAAASPLPAAGASHGGCREAAPSCR